MTKALSGELPHKILIASDLGPASGALMKYAEILKPILKPEMVLLYAQHFDVPPYFTEGQISFFAKELKEAHKTARQHITKWAKDFLVDIAKIDLREEPPVEAVLLGARENRADLIMLGSHGRKWAGRVWLGSVAENVIRRSSLPVLIVPPHSKLAAVKKILSPVGFGEIGQNALNHAAHWAKSAKAKLVILRAWEAEREKMHYPWSAKELPVQCEIDEISLEGNPAEEILKFAEAESPDLIVMGSDVKKTTLGAVFSSTTERILHATRWPILIIPKTATNAQIKEI